MELRDHDKEMGLPLPLSSSQTPNPRPPQTLNHYPNIDPVPPGSVAGAEPEPVGSSLVVRYRECLKNHAATMGGHVVDGCGEFMPSGEEGTMAAMKCAACECHRNFHRKEINGESQYIPPLPRRNGVVHLPQQPVRFPAPVMMSFGGGGGGTAEESSSEDLRHDELITVPQSSKKRFRTKFSQDQKEKMMEFAETLGWRIQKQDEHELQMFCSQVGVKRQVFKVWMHNNKQAMKKKQMVIARDKNGFVLLTSTDLHSGVESTFAAEAVACRRAIQIALEMNRGDVIVEGDSLSIIKKCNSLDRDKSMVGAYIHDINKMKAKIREIRFEYIPRSANNVAHLLASESLRRREELYLTNRVPRYAEKQVEDESVREPD